MKSTGERSTGARPAGISPFRPPWSSPTQLIAPFRPLWSSSTVAFGPRPALRLVMTKAWLAALLALGAFGLIGTASAQASCAQMPALREAVAASPLVFVGTVESTSDGDRVAHVKVESIWK